MRAAPVLQLCLLVVAPSVLRALHHKQQEKPKSCSIKQSVSNELSLLEQGRQSELGCRDAITDGVDFVSIVHRRRRPHHQHRKPTLNSLREQRNRKHHRQGQKKRHHQHGHTSHLSNFDYQSQHHIGYEQGPLGEECWTNCRRPGYCRHCGNGNACCRKGYESDPKECQSVKTWFNGTRHECVETRPSLEAEVVDKKEQLVVWVSGYPRSGSSILLSMVSATVDGNQDAGETFSLFEPCHERDSYKHWMERQGCRQLLYGVSHCDFRGIKQLWGWRDPHSSNNHTKNFSRSIASDLCQDADIVAFKTVDWGHNLENYKWLLDTRPNMKVLDVVRDPRAIYASWKKLEPFKSLVHKRNFYTLGDICDHFAMNLDFKDPRVHRVIFEDLMRSPREVTENVYEFLEEPFTSDQEEWISKAFNAAECPEPLPGMKGYTDCHTWTGVDPRGDEDWRNILSKAELSYFEQSEACQRVASEYRYPPK